MLEVCSDLGLSSSPWEKGLYIFYISYGAEYGHIIGTSTDYVVGLVGR